MSVGLEQTEFCRDRSEVNAMFRVGLEGSELRRDQSLEVTSKVHVVQRRPVLILRFAQCDAEPMGVGFAQFEKPKLIS